MLNMFFFKGMYNYRPRARIDSLNNYPSDTESTCSSRIPRYYGNSRKNELSDNDVKQIVKLVKTGEKKLSSSSHSEIVIKRDPLSNRWHLSSMPTLKKWVYFAHVLINYS